MSEAKTVLMIGLDPEVVDYAKWPGLTPAGLAAGLEAERGRLDALGYRAEICFVDHGATAEATVAGRLSQAAVDCVLIGAGVRADPDEFLLFETLVNVVHRAAPQARICFNTGPGDAVAAVRRWI